MSLFSRKYRPNKLSEIDFNRDIVDKIGRLIHDSGDEFPNILLHGCQGSGKHTIVNAILNELYGDSCVATVYEHTLPLESSKSVSFFYKVSPNHIEITPSDYGIYDKNILNIYVNEIASTACFSDNAFKIIVIDNVHRLGAHAQEILKRLLESRVKTSRFILIGDFLSPISESIISRCCIYRIPVPSHEEIFPCLMNISKKESIRFTKQAYNKIAKNAALSNDVINLNYMFNCLQLSYLHGKYIQYDMGYRKNMDVLIHIIKSGDLSLLGDIRQILYDFYIFHMESAVIIKYIVNDLIMDESTPENLKTAILDKAIECELNSVNGNKEVVHVESFICGLMHILHSE